MQLLKLELRIKPSELCPLFFFSVKYAKVVSENEPLDGGNLCRV